MLPVSFTRSLSSPDRITFQNPFGPSGAVVDGPNRSREEFSPHNEFQRFSPSHTEAPPPSQAGSSSISNERLDPPSDIIRISARNVIIGVHQSTLPATVIDAICRLGTFCGDDVQSSTVALNIQESVLHRILDYHRDRKVPISLSSVETDMLKSAAKWLDDKALLHELKFILPLRKQCKLTKHTSGYAINLWQLANAYENAGDFERARKKRIKAFVFDFPSSQSSTSFSNDGHAAVFAYGQSTFPCNELHSQHEPTLPDHRPLPLDMTQTETWSYQPIQEMEAGAASCGGNEPAEISWGFADRCIVRSDSDLSSKHSLWTAMSFPHLTGGDLVQSGSSHTTSLPTNEEISVDENNTPRE